MAGEIGCWLVRGKLSWRGASLAVAHESSGGRVVMKVLGGLLVLGVLFAAVWGWETLKERQDGVGNAARGASEVAGVAGRGLARLFGVVLAVLGLVLLFGVGGSAGVIVLGLVLVVYGGYLAFGGSWVVF